MATVTASFTWPGPDTDVLRIFVEPTPEPWGAEAVDEDVLLFRALNDREELTDRIAGLEIVGFLDFDRWEDLPETDLQWRLPGQPAQPLADLLRTLQPELRARVEAPALVQR
ncbi:MAG TPA: hypothetical protein VH482_28350 [Thermomicrobiales bacterium]|jgi:hypothetical protein